MAIHPHAVAANTTLRDIARHVVERFAAPRADRLSRRLNKAAAAQLQQMDPRLLDDIGATAIDRVPEGQPLARLNPMVVAVNLYTTPRIGR